MIQFSTFLSEAAPKTTSDTKQVKKPKKNAVEEKPMRISPSGWPEHMHQAHTDGTHGGMTF